MSRVRISGYRCLKSIQLDLDAYTVLIGTNGTGKSSVLYALDWFFNGGTMDEGDVHTVPRQDSADPIGQPDRGAARRIEVEVTFDQLDEADRQILGRYARGETVRLRRSWSDGKEKMIGNSRQGPGFAEVRAAERVAEMRTLYGALRKELTELPAVTAKDDILGALTRWEDDPANRGKLVDVADDDATHLFGFAGEEVLAKRFRLILVPAAVDIAAAVGTAGKGSVLSQLIGALTTEAMGIAKREWETKHQAQLEDLGRTIKQSVEEATKGHIAAVNRHFSELVATGEVKFTGEPPAWSLRGDATVTAEVMVNGVETDVARQGHGVQRALMMAVLQTMVGLEGEGGDPIDVAEELPDLGDSPRLTPPCLLLCLEEPEIYQHPVRARHFARVLTRLSTESGSQVLLATHSPYFVLPAQFAALRRFSADQGVADVVFASPEEIVRQSGIVEDRVLKCMEKEVPRTFSEGFFADAAVLVEGDTDRAVIETVAERLGSPLDARGIAVLSMESKENLRVPAAILSGIGIPVYVVADGDALGGRRKHPTDAAKADEVSGSHRRATETLLKWLPKNVHKQHGEIPTAFGAPTGVTSGWTLFHDDLEEELTAWPGFETELQQRGCELREKNVAAYRAASHSAPIDKIPDALRAVVSALAAFAASAGKVEPGESA
jgi:putative ATP-dependent endonuclease of the OLD family